MAANKRLLVLPGDGIGPEVMRQVRRIMDWMDKRRAVSFDVKEGLVGGAAIDAHKTPLTDETMQMALDADAVLFGSVGGPKWDSLPFDRKPERGLLRLRKEMDLYANLRPAYCFAPLVKASSSTRRSIRPTRSAAWCASPASSPENGAAASARSRRRT
jgi:3-isopropylmalate dehydrogenase